MFHLLELHSYMKQKSHYLRAFVRIEQKQLPIICFLHFVRQMLCDWADIIDWIIFFAVQVASFILDDGKGVLCYKTVKHSALAWPCLA